MSFPRRQSLNRGLRAALFAIALFGIGCVGYPTGSPESALLVVFEEKLTQLKTHENGSYVDYFTWENSRFAAEQSALNSLITVINKKYDGLTAEKRIAYENDWRARFQPVINEIHTRTQAFVTRETGNLTPETMATITELSHKRRMLEKELPRVSLKPRFFEIPETP